MLELSRTYFTVTDVLNLTDYTTYTQNKNFKTTTSYFLDFTILKDKYNNTENK